MPDSRCVGSGTCLHDLVNSRDNEDTDSEFVEVDPSRRYGRYTEVLGRGAFKTVYRAFDEVDGIEVAWNQIKVQDVLQTPEDLERLYSEVHLLKTLKHKNIIKFYHSWVDTNTKNLNFITEIFTSGTLRQYRNRHKHVDIKAVKNWSRQILRGLLYLHSHDPPIIHRDLKCDNIFVNGNQGEVKIGDLGLAAILRQAHAAHSVIGTPEFMAPELYEEEYTELVDIYSFGMCLLEMATIEYPYSECTNAAQIYKRVTSGKKPEALNKVKDPELRKFVEKCLATASSRLPARELLMDPFLQSDGDCEAIDCLTASSRAIANTDDMDDLGALLGEAYCRFASVSRNSEQKDSFSTLPDYNQADKAPLSPGVVDLKSRPAIDIAIPGNSVKTGPRSHLKEEKAGSNMDFRVKCKRREDDTVQLRLRIANPKGEVRVIHFPFDVEADTAMCVASEMVEELEITNQDVTKIAEIIDAALLALVPGWRPGVAIDETCGGEGEDNLSRTPIQDEFSRTHSIFDPLSTMSSESSLLEQSPCGPMSWRDSSGAVALGSTSPPQTEATIHGRFEEVTYHHRRPEHSACVAAEQCTVSSESSEVMGGWQPTDEASSPGSPISDPSFPEHTSAAMHSPSWERPRSANEAAAAFNELVEARRKAGFASYTPERWKLRKGPDVDRDAASDGNLRLGKNVDFFQKHARVQKSQQFLSALDFPTGFDDDDNNELVTQELRELSLRYEQELRELQRKHEEALLELRNRWRHKRASPYASSTMRRWDCAPSYTQIKQEAQPDWSSDHHVNEHPEVAHHEVLRRVPRNMSESDIRRRSHSDRLSLKELTSVLAQVNNQGACDTGSSSRDMEGSREDLSSVGQTTLASSLKVARWDGPAFPRDSLTNEGLTSSKSLYKAAIEKSTCHKLATLRGQNLMDSDAGVLFLPVKAEPLEQVQCLSNLELALRSRKSGFV